MKHNITIEDINKLLSDNDCCYGLRADDFKYKIGDICHKSHQLFQDPNYDENGELIYPYCENGNDIGEIIISDATVVGKFER